MADSSVFWGIEQKLSDIAAGVGVGSDEVDVNVDGMNELLVKLESIDKHLVEIAEGIPAAIDRLNDQLAIRLSWIHTSIREK